MARDTTNPQEKRPLWLGHLRKVLKRHFAKKGKPPLNPYKRKEWREVKYP